jgi:hypothetical protein
MHNVDDICTFYPPLGGHVMMKVTAFWERVRYINSSEIPSVFKTRGRLDL